MLPGLEDRDRPSLSQENSFPPKSTQEPSNKSWMQHSRQWPQHLRGLLQSLLNLVLETGLQQFFRGLLREVSLQSDLLRRGGTPSCGPASAQCAARQGIH